jgi:molybdenum cofactor cytidylyltransferase
MKFSRFPLHEAEGAILAHSIATPRGVIKKGRKLGSDEIARLRAAGIDAVVAARLEAGDVGEDEAARRLAHALAGSAVREAAPFTGRANLFALSAGLAVIDAQAIARINALDEGLTVATVPPFERVGQGQMIATVKVITFALPDRVVSGAEAIARGAGQAIRVAPLVARTAGLILTQTAATKASVLNKRREAIAVRLAALGCRLGPIETVAHREEAVAGAIARMRTAGADPILIFAASAIVDRGDVIPAGLLLAGGEIERLGMPVDPGNLMLLGRIGATAVVGAPSCAASPKLNGFDWILERLVAGLAITSADVAGMGVGGLLKEIATRPQPREGSDGAEDGEEGARRAPRIGAILLAAGRSTRFGGPNKLLAELAGKPVVRHAAEGLLQSQARPVIVVTGHMAEAVRAALAGLEVSIVHNAEFASGMSTSLRKGIAALPAGTDGVVVALADMPRIAGSHIDRLIAAFAPKENRSIIVPVTRGERGNPVLFGAEHFAELAAIAGDTGARHIIGQHADQVAEVDLDDEAIFMDVDTPDALSRLAGTG